MGDIRDSVLAFFVWLWAFWQVKFLLAHISLNVVAAIAVSIRINEFQLVKTGEFLYRKVLPYLLLFGAGAAFGDAAGQAWMTTAAFLALEAMLWADFLDNLKLLGLPIPPFLTQDSLTAADYKRHRERREAELNDPIGGD